MTARTAIYVYDEVEVLDFAGPYEVFSTASRVAARIRPEAPPPFEVFLVAESRRTVRARNNFAVEPHFSLNEHPRADIVIVPGGVHGPELERPAVIEWLALQRVQAKLVASVCTGAFLLARAGALGGVEVTTHWEDLADLRREFPGLLVRDAVRWTESDRIMTSAGISSGLDMSLRIVARFAGQELAERTAKQMEYDWRREPASKRD